MQGGLPYWILHEYPNIKLRSSDQGIISFITYFDIDSCMVESNQSISSLVFRANIHTAKSQTRHILGASGI